MTKVEIQNEKKWFIYLVDHHEGPYTAEAIVEMIRQGTATPSHYVWRDGLADWDVLTTIPEFKALLSSGAKVHEPSLHSTPAKTPEVVAAPVVNTEPQAEPVAEPEVEAVVPEAEVLAESTPDSVPEPVAETVEDLSPLQISTSTADSATQFMATPMETIASESIQVLQPEAQPASVEAMAPVSQGSGYVAPIDTKIGKKLGDKPPRRSIGKILLRAFFWFLFFSGLAFVGTSSFGVLKPYLTHPALKPLEPASSAIHNFVGGFFSNIPEEVKVSAEDKRALEMATRGQPKTEGIKLAFASSQDDLFQPTIYISTNLPDGAVVNLWVEGVSETLLNHFHFSSQSRIVIAGKLGKTGKLLSSDGKPIPRGKYVIRAFVPVIQGEEISRAIEGIAEVPVSDSRISDQKPRAYIEKTLFLGGPEDDVYRSRLNDFHQKVREKASKELLEIKQFFGALNGQMDLSVAKFTALSQGTKDKRKLADWKAFRSQWAQFTDHMSRQFKQWSDLGAQDVYYGEIYTLVRDVGAQVIQAHEVQNQYFDSRDRVLSVANRIKINESITQTEAQIEKLKKMIDECGDPMTLGSGLPKKPL